MGDHEVKDTNIAWKAEIQHIILQNAAAMAQVARGQPRIAWLSGASTVALHAASAKGIVKALSVVLDTAAFSTNDHIKLMVLVRSKQGDNSVGLELSAPAAVAYQIHSAGILN